MNGRPHTRPIGSRQPSHLDGPVTVISAGRPICRCMSRQAGLSAGRHAGRPIGRQSNRLAGLLAGRTGGRTVAGAVVGLLVGPAKW